MLRTILTALAVFAITAGGAEARRHAGAYHAYRSHTYSPSVDTYTNVSGHHVHRPVYAAQAPRGASAQCRDGSYSFSEHARGTCSHHGGVASWR
jgi:hypothetical protein